MLFAMKEAELVLALVRLNMLEIHTLVADPNAYKIPIARIQKLALTTSVKIHAPELVA
jgi:hypothetical protein